MLVRLSGMIEKRSSKSRVQALYRARSGTFGNRDDRVDLIGSVNPALYRDCFRYTENIQRFGFGKKRNCTFSVANTKALIRCAVIAQLICAFCFRIGKNLVFS